MKKLLLTLTILCSSAFAQDVTNMKKPAISPEIKAAVQSCVATSPKNSEGKPDRDSVKKCLDAKGIHPPKHEPGANLPPEMREKAKVAFKQCNQSIPQSSDKKQRHEAMKSCIESKGITLPQKPNKIEQK